MVRSRLRSILHLMRETGSRTRTHARGHVQRALWGLPSFSLHHLQALLDHRNVVIILSRFQKLHGVQL